jgi:hypothetical protein
MRRSLLVLTGAAAFGGLDQYVGSLSAHPLATAVSLLSAPWLLVAFFAGSTQSTLRRAAVFGLASTYAALVGYWAMTLSPVEGAHMTAHSVRGVVISQSLLVLGGLFIGPFFGGLGHLWRMGGRPEPAIAAALAVAAEPFAHAAAGSAFRVTSVAAAEIAAGLLMVLYVFAGGQRRRSDPT